MPILKIKLVDASGHALPSQTVLVTDNGQLQSNADGIVRFLLGEPALISIEVNGLPTWTGRSDQLAREEKFQQGGAGFARVN